MEHSHHLHTDESWLYVSNGSSGCAHRKILSWSISSKMEAERCVQVFKDAVAKYGKPDTINSDQSSQYTGIKWSQYVEEDLKIKRSTDGKGRLWKTIKYDYIYLLPADDYFEFFKGVKTTSATITRKSIRP